MKKNDLLEVDAYKITNIHFDLLAVVTDKSKAPPFFGAIVLKKIINFITFLSF